MKLYRFSYSPYARKVQMLLDLIGARYETIDVKYSDRDELAELTGGYIYVPVLVADDGSVIKESRDICEWLLVGAAKDRLVPAPLTGPIWAYADFADGPLEDVLFRIATPYLQKSWPTPGERALFTLIKERKFGPGCAETWAENAPALIRKAQRLLAPTLETLRELPFLFGQKPTLADAALYGELAMLEAGDPSLPARIAPELAAFARRLEAACPR